MSDPEFEAWVRRLRAAQHDVTRYGTPTVRDEAETLARVVDAELDRRARPKGKSLFDLIDELPANAEGVR